ncbi:MAG: hypothetical protein ACRDYA_02295 [Egibacteraceae bacterium]
MGDRESDSSLPAAAWTPPWEWNAVSIRALMKVRGDSAHTLAKDAYVVDRAVEGWIYDGRCPNPGSAKELYRLWAQLDAWQREVFDALRAVAARAKGKEPLSMSGEVIIVPIDRRALLAGLGGAVGMPTGRVEIPKRVAPEAVDYFHAQLNGHYQADMLLGPLPLIGTVAAQYQVIGGLAGIATDKLRRDLLGLGVAYATLAGWLYQDAGHLAQSAYWYAEALELAHRAHDPELVSYALARKAMLRTDQRDGQGVIDLAAAALADSGKLCPKARVLAMQQAAHGYSLVNDRGEVDRLLDGAAGLLDRVDDEYPWGNACRRTPGYVEIQRATCYGRMPLAVEAARLWEQLLPHLPPTSRRDYGVYRARQATALAGCREPEQAVKVAAEVVPIVAETGSARMRGELLALRERMVAWKQEEVWRELDELLVSITPSNVGTLPMEGGA